MFRKKIPGAGGRRLPAWAEEDGWFRVDAAPGKEGDWEYSFTVGLEHTFRHPELAVFGVPPFLADTILSNAVRSVRGGRTFGPGTSHYGLAGDRECRIVEFPDSGRGRLFDAADRFYEGSGYRMSQIAWPDRNGRFPWESGVDPSVNVEQPVIGKESYWSQYAECRREVLGELPGGVAPALGRDAGESGGP